MRQKEYERSRAIHTVPTALRQVSKIPLTLNLILRLQTGILSFVKI